MALTVNKKAFCVLEFAKTESIVTVQRRFRIMYHTETTYRQNNSWMVHEIPAEWLPVRCETNRPSGPIGWDSRACARSVCQEPSEVNNSREPGIAMSQSSVWRILRKRLRVKGFRLQLLQAMNSQDHNLRLRFCLDFQQRLLEEGFAEKLVFSDDPKPPLHSHNWLSFDKFQDTERFLIHCERHFSSRLPPSCGTWKYAKAPSTKKNLEIFSAYWYAPFCRVCLGCCAVEFGNPGGTYE